MRGINIQKYINVFLEERVFSHVGCLSLSGFDEISEAVSKAGTSLTEKAEQERKKVAECILTHVSCGRLQMHGTKSKVRT